MAKRPYVKKSEYWNKEVKVEESKASIGNFNPEFGGRGILESHGSRTGADLSGDAPTRRNRATTSTIPLKYNCIDQGLLPYTYSKDGVSVREALILCQKAYANVPIVKNSVDLMAEFANSEIFLEGGNEASRKFFEAWLSVIRLDKLKSQYFLEYYRGSNIFLYKQMGQLSADSIKKLSKYMSVDSRLGVKVPLRYTLLNPVDVVGELASSFSPAFRQFYKVLSIYELERLKNPKNPVDEQILATFSEEDQKRIRAGQFHKGGLKIAINPQLLLYSFAKKQDYEPFSIPFIFPVLSDINAKMEMKKLDQAVMRTVENIILLITMGAEPDKGGVNEHNITAMQRLFSNESVGRTLIADYTTKGEFIMPDISKVVGKEKYEVLNEDIKEGLQNIVTGNDKYASTAIKAQLFIERLNESRSSFLNDILIPEMNLVANALGFKVIPTPKFQETTLKDEVQFTRAVTRLMELTLLTPEQGLQAIQNGRLPEIEDHEADQKAFKKQRDSGLYEPLIGGGNKDALAKAGKKPLKKQSGRPTGSKTPKTSKANVSVAAIQESVGLTNEFFSFANAQAKAKYGELNEIRKGMIQELATAIIVGVEEEGWQSTFAACLEDNTKIASLSVLPEILDIASEFDISDYEAALIYHGDNIQD